MASTSPLQKNLWVKPMGKYTETINSKRFQSILKVNNEFALKFILPYWGLIGFDFGFINLSNAFLDRLMVPKYHFKTLNKQTAFTHKFFYRTSVSTLKEGDEGPWGCSFKT